MLKIEPPNYRFCPLCGHSLIFIREDDKQRKHCEHCGWTYYPKVAAAVTAITVRGTRVLLVKRGRDPFRGTWMFPSGFVDFGEHPEEAVARELREETGLELVRLRLLGVFQSEDDERALGHFVFIYRVEAKSTRPATDQHENEAIEWFDLKGLPIVVWKLHRFFLGELQRGGAS